MWLDEESVLSMEWVTKRIVPYDSQLGICLCQSSVCNWDSCCAAQTGCDWQLGQRAFGSILVFVLARDVPGDLKFMLQYISRTAYGCNEDEKQTEHRASFYMLLRVLKTIILFHIGLFFGTLTTILLVKQTVNKIIKKRKWFRYLLSWFFLRTASVNYN